MSKDCRDLLLRLLERSPDARITFAEFFSHSFVDLEHMPSAHSLVKAVRNERLHVCLFRMSINDVRHVIGCARALVLVPAPRSLSPSSDVSLLSSQKELVLQAVEKDQTGQWSAALSLYCSALEHFVPAIHCKSNKHSHLCVCL